MHLKKIWKTTAALVLLASLAGCGYHFKGVGLTAPAGVRTIAVTVLENRTSESGIESHFTGDIAYEFTRSKVLRVVGADAADAVLSGTVASLVSDTISHDAKFMSDERRVAITLDLAVKRRDGEIIWSDRALSGREVFKVDSSDKLATERNKRTAIKAISKRLAEKVHDRILLDF
ncbi:MAG: hypothetical protein HWN68_10550 [Desulfobacterales bacterium]|nr:hypothetical protein [Desulfobacterales bacterium]